MMLNYQLSMAPALPPDGVNMRVVQVAVRE